jgi:V/A-type H+-transporting ATPase subunit D
LALERAFDSLIELAEKEKQARLLAVELAMTRRRVNVLEHVVIPELQETIKFIYDKLGEAERDNTSRLMKIADIIRADCGIRDIFQLFLAEATHRISALSILLFTS